MKSPTLSISIIFRNITVILLLFLLLGCVGKHNIPVGPTMDLVAIKYDSAWLLGDGSSMHGAAERGFREVLELAPKFAEARYNLAIALSHQTKWDEAKSEFNRVLAINPNFELAVMGLEISNQMLSGEKQLNDIEIPRYCRIFHKLYELGC